MPGQHCPACGAAQTGYGCGCLADSDVTDTAVLPLIEGPPLVRPYVPEVAMTGDQADDPYGTAVLPPLPPMPMASPPLPPSPPSHGAPRELGLFPIAAAPETAPRRGGSRRAGRRRSRTLTMVGAGAGVVALGVGLAFAFSSTPTPHQDSLEPLPSSVPDLAPSATASVAPTSAAPTLAPSTPPASSARPSPSRTRASARPSTQTPISVTSAPAPTSAPPVTSAPPSPTDSPTDSPQTLSYGMSGPQVSSLQQQLAAAGCGRHLHSGVYDDATTQAVINLQQTNGLNQDQSGVYGPETRQALESGANCMQ
ncbi:hypothetical protein P3T36_004776 [Kitasatospora sp. MAP12-15]|uniref:peptidoglycan-binding domain-containing protein n=1 Tax=unclassified Kitasatospora TaxID=2633591 RepID=UPI0024747C1B|nr:peptidoglycan-binding domain-containing protein [Kitasatospora sp. MAP12-44]MDH6110292.1 hypothetical protein [Kitasatospora sp. MAP12-44]